MIDYHIHGNFCGHAEGELEEYVLEALGKGFLEIGFSAHLPKVVDPDPYHAMLENRLPDYVALIEHLQIKYHGNIIIKLGIEADYFPGLEDRTRDLLAKYTFDYVLGSLHFLGDWHFSSKAGRHRYESEDPEEVFPKYFELLGDMIRSGLFDVLAHADALRKETFEPGPGSKEEYVKLAMLLAKHGMAIEVNTAGLRRGAGCIYPDRLLLEACAEKGIPVTLGSDAHTPTDVGRDFRHAFRLLEEAGIVDLAIFEGRKMERRPLSDFQSGAASSRLYELLSGEGGLGKGGPSKANQS
jgi:histidinol-phosphatase (PHP family)